MSSYTLSGWLKEGDMQRHKKEGFSPEMSCKMEGNGLTFTLPLDDANIYQALFGPSRESPHSYLHSFTG